MTVYNKDVGAGRNVVMIVIKITIFDDEEKAVVLHEQLVKNCLQACGIGYEMGRSIPIMRTTFFSQS